MHGQDRGNEYGKCASMPGLKPRLSPCVGPLFVAFLGCREPFEVPVLPRGSPGAPEQDGAGALVQGLEEGRTAEGERYQSGWCLLGITEARG